MLTIEQLERRLAEGSVDTVLVVFSDLYGRLMGKRYDAGFFLEEAVDHGAHACDYLFTVDVEMNPVAGYGFSNWESGYGDVHLLPDLTTLRVASWLGSNGRSCSATSPDATGTGSCRWRRDRSSRLRWSARGRWASRRSAHRSSSSTPTRTPTPRRAPRATRS